MVSISQKGLLTVNLRPSFSMTDTEIKFNSTNETRNVITHAFTRMSSTPYTFAVILEMGAKVIIMKALALMDS